jgi:hypothetical protein
MSALMRTHTNLDSKKKVTFRPNEYELRAN